MNDTIVFLKDDVELGRFHLPEYTTERQRYMIAKENGIDSYDQYQFFLGTQKRFDSIDAPQVYDHDGTLISVAQAFYKESHIPISLKWKGPHALQDQQG